MKWRSVLVIIIVFISSVTAFAQESVLSNLSELKGVSTVYISKSMLSTMKGRSFNNLNIGNIAGKLNNLEILNIDNNSSVRRARIQLKTLNKDKSLEVIMKMKDDDDMTTIYGERKGGNYTKVVMVVDEGDEITIINMSGQIKLDQISNLTR